MNQNYLLLLLVLMGLLFIFSKSTKENFTSNNRCPNILIQKGNDYYLYNSKIAKVPGVNPIKFNKLEDYTEFIDWQRSQGIRCPILYLRKSYDTQGNENYTIRPSPTELQGGLPNNILTDTNSTFEYQEEKHLPDETSLIDATRDNNDLYNSNSYPSVDTQNQNIGLYTPLDKMYNENEKSISPNPMDPNWGGATYTQKLIDSGYYADNEVSLRV